MLLLPVGYQAGQKVPMLVEPHGGPTGAHNAGFKASNGSPGQYWAGKGWATFYPNPRGSTGYGDAFLEELLGRENDVEVADILAGVDAMVARGVADPDRLGVMGWSNGGYLTNCLVAKTGRFKAASSDKGWPFRRRKKR